MQEKQIVLNGKNFFYRIAGDGPVIVLLHGFGEDSSIWDRQFDIFGGYQLVIPDLPGSGRSEMTDDMSMEGLAKTIREFISVIGIERCTMIGHSMGGYVTLAFAEKYPDVLNGFGLFHSTAYADSEEKKQTRKKGIQFLQKHGAFEFLKTTIPNLYSPLTKSQHPELVQEQLDHSHDFAAPALISYYNSMIERPNRASVLETDLPVLMVLGKYDVAAPVKDGLEQCFLPSLSYIHILDGVGHMGMREDTSQSNSILVNYLNSIHHLPQ
jgi:pimeloyl-ACP methyl ester carboxylesterase